MKKKLLALLPGLVVCVLALTIGLAACAKTKPSDENSDATTPLTALESAFESTLDEDGELSLPVSIGFDAFGATEPLNGELSLCLTTSDVDRANDFDIRFDVDLSNLPLISDIADTLTLRCLSDGTLLVMLVEDAQGKDTYLATYAVDIGSVTQLIDKADLDIAALIKEIITVEKETDGYTLSLKSATVTLLNGAYQGLISTLEENLSDTHGYLKSLFEATFTGVSVKLTGADKISAIDVAIKGEPPINVTKGEKFDINFDIGLLSSSGMLEGAFEGDLQLRFNPAAIWAKDYFAIAEAGLHLDLTPAGTILGMVSMFAPAGSLPEFVNPTLSSMDVYYTGDGVLTLALNNTAEDPVFVTQVDLKTVQMPELPEDVTSSLLAEFRFEKKANGFLFALGDPIVQIVDEAYQGLVTTAKDYITASAGTLGEIAGALIENMIGASIDDIEFFIGTDEDDNLMFDFAVKGVPVFDAEDDYYERRLLSLMLTHGGELTEEESKTLLAGKETVSQLVKNAETAAGYTDRIQDLVDNMDLTESGKDAYFQKVDALKEEINGLAANVRSLISNTSYLADTNYNDETLAKLLVMHALYSERAKAFEALLPAEDNYEGFEEWDALNALYDSEDTTHQNDLGITVPAVKDSPAIQKAVGEDRVKAFVAARDKYETPIVQSLRDRITQSTAKYKDVTADATARDELLALLQDYLEVKPIYEALSEEKRKELSEKYNAYMALAYTKNFDGLKQAYEAVKTKMQALAQNADATVDNLLEIMKELVPVYEWKSGMDLWQKRDGERKPWLNWLNYVPSQYSAQAKEISDLDSEVHIKGNTTNELVDALKDKIVTALKALNDERKQYVKDDVYDFTGLPDGETLLEKLHEWRYFINRVLPNAVKSEFRKDQDLKDIVDGIVKYENALSEYLASQGE